MGGPAPAVHDGEHLVRGEVTERRDRYRDPERDGQEHVVQVIDGQVQPGQAEDGEHHGHGGLGVGARAARHRQAVHRAHEEDREHADRRRRRRVPAPAVDDGHAVGTRPGQAVVDPLPDYLQEEQAAHEDQQVPPAPEDHRQRDHRQPHHGDPPARAGLLDPAGQAGQPGRPRIREPAQQPGVGPVVEPEPRGVLGKQESAGHDRDSEQEPRRGRDPERMRQGRRRTGRTPLAAGSLGRSGPRRDGRRHGALCVLAHRAPSFLGSTGPGPVTSGVDPVCGESFHHALAGPH